MVSIEIHAAGFNASVLARICPICPGNLKFHPPSALARHLDKHPGLFSERVCKECERKFRVSKFNRFNFNRCPACRHHGVRGPARRLRGVVEKKENITIARPVK